MSFLVGKSFKWVLYVAILQNYYIFQYKTFVTHCDNLPQIFLVKQFNVIFLLEAVEIFTVGPTGFVVVTLRFTHAEMYLQN